MDVHGHHPICPRSRSSPNFFRGRSYLASTPKLLVAGVWLCSDGCLGSSQGRSTRFAAFNATRHQGLAPGGLKGTPKLVESLVKPVPVALVAARWGPGGDLFIFYHEGHRLLLGSIQDV